MNQNRPSTLFCLIDESGTLLASEKEPFRVGFLVTRHPDRLAHDIRSLKRELPPIGKHGEYHAREDHPYTREMLQRLLCLNTEPLMYIVEWIKEEFSKEHFEKGKLQVFKNTNPIIASFAIIASEFAAAASANGFSEIHVIAEAVKGDIKSEHRSREQAFNSVLRTVFEKQSTIKVPPPGTQSIIKVSTKRKKECPPLSFADYWLWAYCRHTDHNDEHALPPALKKRTYVERMTELSIKSGLRNVS